MATVSAIERKPLIMVVYDTGAFDSYAAVSLIRDSVMEMVRHGSGIGEGYALTRCQPDTV